MGLLLGAIKLVENVVSFVKEVKCTLTTVDKNDVQFVFHEVFSLESEIRKVNVDLIFVDDHPANITAINDPNGILESMYGKSNTAVIAETSIEVDGRIKLFIYLNPIMKIVEENDLDYRDLYKLAYYNIRHELYHAKQFKWIYDRAGAEAVYAALREEAQYTYSEGPIERGAYNFSLGNIEQNFEEELGKFTVLEE